MFHYRTHISPRVLPPKSPVLKRAAVTGEQYASKMANSAGQESAAMRPATNGAPDNRLELMQRAAELISGNGSTKAQIQAALGVTRNSAASAIGMLSDAGRIIKRRAGPVELIFPVGANATHGARR